MLVFDLRLFGSGIMSGGIGLGLFGQGCLTLGSNPKEQLFVSFFN